MPDSRNQYPGSESRCDPHSFVQGEIVEVQGFVYRTNFTSLRHDDPHVWFTQRFVAYHNDVFYCERDDGERHVLIGWYRCRKKRHNEPYYYNDEPIESDVHYVKS